MSPDPYARALAQPGSIAARNALAAHWRAQGDPRAELIDKQLEYRELDLLRDWASPRPQQLRAEIAAIVEQHGRTYAGRLADLVDKFEFKRGLVAAITVSGEDVFRVLPEALSLAPIQHLYVTAPLGDRDRLFAVPELARLVSLNFPRVGAAFGDEGAIALARSPHLAKLKYLELFNCAITRVGVEAIAASPYLTTCAFISFGGNACDPTPEVYDWDGIRYPTYKEVGAEIAAKFGQRAWLTIPDDDEYPPSLDELAVTP
jgi:hypothetical protein